MHPNKQMEWISVDCSIQSLIYYHTSTLYSIYLGPHNL